jgi:hypothetical protein
MIGLLPKIAKLKGGDITREFHGIENVVTDAQPNGSGAN